MRKWAQFTQAFERRKTEEEAEGRKEKELLLSKMARIDCVAFLRMVASNTNRIFFEQQMAMHGFYRPCDVRFVSTANESTVRIHAHKKTKQQDICH